MLLNILLIAVILVIITDLSGVTEYIKSHLYYRLRGTYNYPDSWDTPIIHLLSCSLCQTVWAGLIYLIIAGGVTFINIAFLLLIAFLTTTIKDFLLLLKEVLDRTLNKLYEMMDK